MNIKLIRIILFLLFAAATGAAQTSEFTYQGKLNDSGNPANATYEMQFRLFDNANAGQGTQQGTTVTKSAVAVAGGIFDVALDFGAAPFAAGAERYLEISIRPSGSTGGFTALAPRQKLTAAPYAVKSLSAATADTATNAQQLAGVSGNQFVQTNDPRLTDARQPTSGSSAYIQNTSTEQPASNFTISGVGTASVLNATARYNLLGFPYLRPSQSFSTVLLGLNAGNDSATGLGNTALGDSAGHGLTTGTINTFVGFRAGDQTTTGHDNIFIGHNSGHENVTGSSNTIVNGYLSGSNLSFATAIGAGAHVGTSNTVVIGRNTDTVRIAGNLNIAASGIGTGPLCLNANTFYVGLCSSSIRYKTNVATYRPGLNLVTQLRPVTFNWKDGNIADVGLVAEEVEKVDPLLVTYNPQGQIQGVKYDRVGVVLLNAVKEQQQQIDAQTKANAELQKQVNDLRNQIEDLRQLIVCRTTTSPEVCKEER
ncbi:MAG TPA: tail fiber domain-containing protein [Pyrinomonadaceae bacterium]